MHVLVDGGSLFYNYKHYFSVVLLAVCDSNYNFTLFYVGSYGISSDSQFFTNSELFEEIKENHCLSRARRFIGCTFGILTNKWRIFHRPMNVSVSFATYIVKACYIIHNFVRKRDGYTLNVAGLEDTEYRVMPQARNNSAIAITDKFADYFSSGEGSVPWQLSKI